jgi:4-amino-4-deoxy-L-arabinose transferase-like glycosyltransferase
MSNARPSSAGPSPSGPSPSEIARDHSFRTISCAILILLTLYVCYFSHLGAFGLIGPDEPRYAWIARDMAESGDWITPRLYGKPWFEKPILYYWGAAVSFKLFGFSEALARLPSALSALGSTLALAWLALRLDGWETARWLLLLLPSTVGMIGFSHAAAPDMPFSALLILAMICAAVALDLVPTTKVEQTLPQHKTSNHHLSLFLFGFFLGDAVLAKGPAAVILAAGAMVLWAVCTKHWRDALHLLHPIAIAAFLLTCLPWYTLCAHRNADFFRIFIIEHNFKRYLTPEFQHIQPFWYYVPITLVSLLPWIFWLVWLAVREARASDNNSRRPQIFFLAAWAFFPVLFFSLSKSKLPGYILPAVPPLGLLISLAVTRALKTKHSVARFAAALPGVVFLVSACWMPFSRLHLRGPLVLVYVLFAAVGGLIVMFSVLLGHMHSALTFTVVLVLCLLTFVYVSASKLDPQLSARSTAAQIGASRSATTYSFKLQRAWHYQLNFYLHREVLEWNPDVAGESVVVTTEKHLAELKNSAQIIAVISNLSPQAEIVAVRPLPLALDIPSGGQPH